MGSGAACGPSEKRSKGLTLDLTPPFVRASAFALRLDLFRERCLGDHPMSARRLPATQDDPPMRHRNKAPLAVAVVSEGMLVRRLVVSPPDVVFVKGILEAS